MRLIFPPLYSLFAQAIVVCMVIHAQPDTADIQWGPCDINGTLPFVCGNISVPLDYSNPNSSEALIIELLKAPAIKQPSKGNILFNWGGPTASGRELMAAQGAQLMATTGGYWDLVSFDPRGAGKTIPFSCYPNTTERQIANLQNPYLNGNSSDTTVGRLWAESENFDEACHANGNSTGGLVGYAFLARDYMRIAEALNEDGLLRFYGLSAGTVLGATIAAMFPDRIDRMVLDGVWNIHEYYHYHAVQGFHDTDKTFSGFLSSCIAAGSNCTLSRLNLTSAQLEESVFDLIETAKYHPIPYQGILLDYTLVRNVIFLSLTQLVSWPALATFLHALFTHNMSELDTIFPSLQTDEDPIFTEQRAATQCGDKASGVRTSDIQDVYPVFEQLEQVSKLAGDRIFYDVDFCSRWKMEAKEKYLGDFNVTTRQPILIIGNTFDPVTPLISARNASASLRGSVVLQHDGFGHTSASQPSLCTAKTTQAYLENGTLPEDGAVCMADVPPFSNVTWMDVLG